MKRVCLVACLSLAIGCDETVSARGDAAYDISPGDVSPGSDLVLDGPAGLDGAQKLRIKSPKANAPLQEGTTVTLEGSGQGSLTWSYDANSDGLGEVTIGKGATVGFLIPAGVKPPKTLTLFLADAKGKIQQDHTITSGPAPDAGPDAVPPADGALPTCKGFVEGGGLVVMEVESAPLSGSWSKRTSVTGYTGSGYYEWKHGDPSTGIDAAGTGILSYSVCVKMKGRYQLHIHSAAPNPTEHNDVWVRFPDTGAVCNKGGGDIPLGKGWFKVFQNTSNNTWQWKAKTTDNVGNFIFFDVNAAQGLKVELSGRSTQFKVDRIVLRHSSVTESDATNTKNPQSPKQ